MLHNLSLHFHTVYNYTNVFLALRSAVTTGRLAHRISSLNKTNMVECECAHLGDTKLCKTRVDQSACSDGSHYKEATEDSEDKEWIQSILCWSLYSDTLRFCRLEGPFQNWSCRKVGISSLSYVFEIGGGVIRFSNMVWHWIIKIMLCNELVCAGLSAFLVREGPINWHQYL